MVKLGLQHGVFAIGDPKDIHDYACADQQDFVHSPILAISVRSGFLKRNTTALAGEVTGIYFLKMARTTAIIAADDDGNLNTL